MITVLKTIIAQFKSSTPKPYDILILEYGIDRPREMEFLCSICKPHISVLTKLDAVHSLQFGTAEDIATEELKLQANTLLKCYINNNDSHGMKLIPSLQTKIAIYNTQDTTTIEKGII
jgi:UDP-N-acetylmuramyl pentapeptide synthase